MFDPLWGVPWFPQVKNFEWFEIWSSRGTRGWSMVPTGPIGTELSHFAQSCGGSKDEKVWLAKLGERSRSSILLHTPCSESGLLPRICDLVDEEILFRWFSRRSDVRVRCCYRKSPAIWIRTDSQMTKLLTVLENLTAWPESIFSVLYITGDRSIINRIFFRSISMFETCNFNTWHQIFIRSWPESLTAWPKWSCSLLWITGDRSITKRTFLTTTSLFKTCSLNTW